MKRHIRTKNLRQHFGRFNRQLVIRLLNKGKILRNNHCHLVLTRRRMHKGSRYDQLGFLEMGQRNQRPWNFLGLNLKKIKHALACGAIFNPSSYKIIFQTYQHEICSETIEATSMVTINKKLVKNLKLTLPG